VTPLVAAFAATRIAPLGVAALAKPIASLLAVCEVVDCYVAIKRNEIVHNFGECMSTFMRRHRDAYGAASFKPKHHWCMHLPEQYALDGTLVDTFVLERKHKMLKSCGYAIRCTARFERTVSVNAMMRQAESLSNCQCGDYLAKPSQQCPLGTVSKCIKFGGETLSAGDVAMIDGCAVCTPACGMGHDSNLFVCGRIMELVERVSAKISIWSGAVEATTSMIALGGRSVRAAYAWRMEPRGLCILCR